MLSPRDIAAAATALGRPAKDWRALPEGLRARVYAMDERWALTVLFGKSPSDAACIIAASRAALADGLRAPRYEASAAIATPLGPAMALSSDLINGRPGDAALAPESIGGALARLHALRPPKTLPRFNPALTAPRAAPPDLVRLVAAGQSALAAMPVLDPVFGHFDLFPDNVIVQPDGGLALADWETAGIGSPLHDAAFALAGLALHRGGFTPELSARLLTGYAAIRPAGFDATALDRAGVWACAHLALERHARFDIARSPLGPPGAWRAFLPLVRARA